MDLISDYPYLASQAVWILFSAAAFFILRRHTRILIFSGLLALPASLYESMLIPEYWNPSRLFALAGLGPEDLIFSFSTGVLALSGLTIYRNNNRPTDIRVKKIAIRMSACLLFGIIVTTFLHILGVGKMWNPFLTMIGWGVLLIFLNQFPWKTALISSSSFVLIYVLGFKISQAYIPEFLDSWTWKNLTRISFGGMPLEEIIWASLYGAIWPLTIFYILGKKGYQPGTFSMISQINKPTRLEL